MTTDEYGLVINSEETYKEIAKFLRDDALVIAWTEEEATQFDILFTYYPKGIGFLQGGVSSTDLFVSIMRLGAFGFDIKNSDTHWTYYDEKLGNRQIGETTGKKLADLINGVKKYLLQSNV